MRTMVGTVKKKTKTKDWLSILQEMDRLQTWNKADDDLLEEWREDLQPLLECIDSQSLVIIRHGFTRGWTAEFGKPLLLMVSRGTKSLNVNDMSLPCTALLSCIEYGLMGIKLISEELKPLDYEKLVANYIIRLSELKHVRIITRRMVCILFDGILIFTIPFFRWRNGDYG
jgi:hypothetical protein